MKEKVLDALKEMGFKVQEEDGGGYSFSYEDLTLLYLPNETDEQFLNLVLPGIIGKTEGKLLQLFTVMDKVNSTLKYVKANFLGDGVGLSYERELIGEEDLIAVLTHMILHLSSAYAYACKSMIEIDEVITNALSAKDDDNAEEIVAEEVVENDDND